MFWYFFNTSRDCRLCAYTRCSTKSLIECAQKAARRVICVFGCGGDRDRGKRATMGKVAKYADYVILTNDNPRGELPQTIVDDIMEGFTQTPYEHLLDRSAAITRAIHMANIGDVVLIAGKGHQQINGVRIPHSDQEL